MKIAMIGSGYVGLVSGACLADFGHDICCVDKDPAKIVRRPPRHSAAVATMSRRSERPEHKGGINIYAEHPEWLFSPSDIAGIADKMLAFLQKRTLFCAPVFAGIASQH